jgi:hypothetical protein
LPRAWPTALELSAKNFLDGCVLERKIRIHAFELRVLGLWLSIDGSLPGGKATPFLGGISFLGLVEVMRRLAKEWAYLGLLLISVSVADESQLRALIERIMDATGGQRSGKKGGGSKDWQPSRKRDPTPPPTTAG